jgi:hypothetical protein
VPAPFGKAPTWAYVLHALGEFNVTVEEYLPPKINGEESPITFILKRAYKGKTYVYAGAFDRNERLLRSVVQNICRQLNLKYEVVFGKLG